MRATVIGLVRRSRADLKRRLRDAVQTSKRVMAGLGVVPPPFRIQVDITDLCNFRCPTCSKWCSADPARELHAEQWAAVLKKVAGLPILREVTITGGEPFARQDIFEILKAAKDQGLYVVVISNGFLVNEDVLARLGEIGVDRLMVSLNSLTESVHDESRAAPGSFRRVMRLVEIWRAMPRPTGLCLAAIVTEPNCGELTALAGFARAAGLDGIIYQVLAPAEAHYAFSQDSRMREPELGWYLRDPLWVRSVDLLRRQVAELIRLQEKGYEILNPSSQLRTFPLYYENPDAVKELPCLGTLSTMYIDPFGDIRLCYGYPPVGNVLRDDPRRAWRSGLAQSIRSESRKCRALCRLLNNNQ